MAEKKEAKVTANLTQESIKVVSESIGVVGLPDEAAARLAVDVTYKLKHLIQEASKFTQHAKRRKLNTSDFDNALKVKNIEPLYGFQSQEYLPFRHASGGGREVHFHEEKELDLQEIITAPLPKVPVDVTMRSHWLSIDGNQPTVAENPPPVSKDLQKQEVVDPSVKATISKPKPRISNEPGKLKHKSKVPEKVKLKELSTHELSVEQQLYYKEITEACVGSDEPRRTEALGSLSSDPGLHQMLPRFTMFIAEGVKVNVVQNNLALLIYLMRMVKSLMDNTTLYLEKYLHDLVPAISTCVLSKQLCLRPDVDNHWALRDFAARQMAQLCRMFNTTTNCIQSRVTKMYSAALTNEKASLATHYGAVVGLQELGPEVVKTFLIPFIKVEGMRLQFALERPFTTEMDRIFVEHIKNALLKTVPSVLKTIRSTPDMLDEYREEFGGFLGPVLHAAVIKSRQVQTSVAHPATPSSSNPFKPGNVAFSQKPSSLLSGSQSGTPLRTMTTTNRFSNPNLMSLTPTTQQKVVIMQQQQQQRPPSTPTATSHALFTAGVNTPTQGPSTPTIIKMVSQNNSVTGVGGSTSAQKIVVVTVASSSSTTSQGQDVGIKSVFTTSSTGLIQQPPTVITLDGTPPKTESQ